MKKHQFRQETEAVRGGTSLAKKNGRSRTYKLSSHKRPSPARLAACRVGDGAGNLKRFQLPEGRCGSPITYGLAILYRPPAAGDFNMKKHQFRQETEAVRGGTEPRQEERSALPADLSDFDLRGHRPAGAGARHSYRQLLHALRQSHAYGRRECHRRTGRHRRGATVLFGNGRDHHFDSGAGEGGRPYRGAARYLRRRDQVLVAVAAETGDRNHIRRYQRHGTARARDPAQTQRSCTSNRRRIQTCGSSIWKRLRPWRASTA